MQRVAIIGEISSIKIEELPGTGVPAGIHKSKKKNKKCVKLLSCESMTKDKKNTMRRSG